METTKLTQDLLNLSNTYDNISFQFKTDQILDLYENILIDREVKLNPAIIRQMELLEETTDYLMLSIFNGVPIIEDLFSEQGEIKTVENDIVIYDNDLYDEDEVDYYLGNSELRVGIYANSYEVEKETCDCELCQECDELECECICDEKEYEDSDREFIAEFIDEEIAEVLIKLEDGGCPHCAIGEALENTFKLGYEQALIDIRKDINIHLGE